MTSGSVAVCDRHYAGIFEAGPQERTSVAAAIRAAREPGVRGVCALFDPIGYAAKQ